MARSELSSLREGFSEGLLGQVGEGAGADGGLAIRFVGVGPGEAEDISRFGHGGSALTGDDARRASNAFHEPGVTGFIGEGALRIVQNL